ncbi:MAG: rhodanese-like domain-containing protein [Pseudomonadota bacterium]
MEHYSAAELKERLSAEPAPLLLDVREAWEYELCHIAGSRHIPMGRIAEVLDELDAEQEIVVICHHGSRSQRVTDFLESNGFSKVANLDGGIHAWACEVDPSLTQY